MSVTRTVLAFLITLSLILQSLVEPAPAKAERQLLLWGNGQEFARFSSNQSITIDVGALDFIPVCAQEHGIPDFITPFADVYIARSGSRSLGGSPNTIEGSSLDGSFVSETIAFTQPSGSVGAGVYAVIYDQCQDGQFDEGQDFVLDPAFEVSGIRRDLPKLPSVQRLKSEALGQYQRWDNAKNDIERLYKAIDEVQQAKDVLDALINPAEALPGLISSYLLDQAGLKTFHAQLQEQLQAGTIQQVDNLAKHYKGIADDPPDAQFRQATAIGARPVSRVDGDTAAARALGALGNVAASEQAAAEALLRSLERYQGAELARDGDWGLVHARGIRDNALLLADYLGATNSALAAVSTSVASLPLPVDEITAEREIARARIANSGFSADERAALRNLGLTDSQISAVRQELAATSFTFHVSTLLADSTGLQAGNIELEGALRALATDMEPIILDLESDSLVLDAMPDVDPGGPYAGVEGDTVAFDGRGTSSVAPITGYQWDLDGDGNFDDATGPITSTVYDRAFSGWVGLRVTNATGRSNVGYAEVTIVEANSPPAVTSISPVEQTVGLRVASDQQFSVTAADPDGDAVKVEWTLDGDVIGSGANLSYRPTEAEIGLHILEAVLTDDNSRGGAVRIDWLLIVVSMDGDDDLWRANADCNDADPNINPGHVEVVANGKDDDCNPATGDGGSPPDAGFTPEGAGRNVAMLEGGASVAAFSSQSAPNLATRLVDFLPTDNGWLSARDKIANQFITILLAGGKTYLIDRVQFNPNSAIGANSRVRDFAIDVSTTTTDESAFTTVLTATAADADTLQEFVLAQPVRAKYVRFRAINNRGNPFFTGARQLKVYTSEEGGTTVPFRDRSTDPDNNIVSWRWTFGDGGSSSEQHPTHTYAAPGNYTVSLTVTDAAGKTDTVSAPQRVLAPPNIGFTVTPTPLKEGTFGTFRPTFTDPDGGVVVAQRWDWGDGTTTDRIATSQQHAFKNNGTYTVTLEMTDSQEQTRQFQQAVTVQNVAPTVDVGRDRTGPDAVDLGYLVTVKITDPGDDTRTCRWDFGDGSAPSTECDFHHAYPAMPAGAPWAKYTATLTVTDQDGGIGSDSLVLTVGNADILALSTTLQDREVPWEVQMAEQLGFVVEIATPADWAAKTTADFASYKAIILGDPNDISKTHIAPAEANKNVWGPALTGNIIIFGTDYTTHAGGLPGGLEALVRPAIAFAAADPGRTGAFITLSEYYDGPPGSHEHTPVPLLDGIRPGGFTVKAVGCYNDAHIVARHPTLDAVTDAFLSNWSCSVHEAFDSWPDDFLVLALARGDGAYYTAADGSQGTPYILARSPDLVPIRDIALAPVTATAEVGAGQTVTATVAEGGHPSVGETVTFTVAAGPHQGTSGTGVTDSQGQAAVTYTGSAVGIDTVIATFVDAQNETQTSNTASIRWTSANNLAPLAVDRSLETLRDTATAVALGGNDGNGDPLTFRVVQAPANGVLSGAPPALTYTPNPGFVGADTFTYVANDGQVDSAPATVTITVRAANQAPVGADQTVITDEDVPQVIVLAASDPDAAAGAPALAFAVVTSPAHGTLSGIAPNLTYTPLRDYSGPDAFTFTASDGLADSAVATITIAVAPVNDPPIADAGHHYHGMAGEPVAFDGSGSSDPEGDVLTFAWDPDYDGVAFAPDPALTGPTPNHTYNSAGNHVIALRVTDAGGATSDIAVTEVEVTEVALAVAAANDGPIDEGQTATIHVTVETAAQAELAFRFDCDGDGTFEIGPQADADATCAFADDGTFLVAVSAGDGQRDAAATTTVVVRNVPPAVDLGENATIDAGTTYTGEGRFADPGADDWTATVDYGEAVGPEPLPLRDFTTLALGHTYATAGSYRLRVCVADDDGDEGCDALTVTVNRVNHPPLAADRDVAVDEDGSLAIVLAASDPDGDALAYRIVTGPSEGTLRGDAPNLTYTPRPGFSGGDTLTFVANDGVADSSPAAVRITVLPVNDAPTAAEQSVRTDEDVPLAITLTGSDPEGDSLAFAVVDAPAHGALTGTAPALTYTPDADYAGDDAFAFRVSDGQDTSARATVRVIVAPVNDRPTSDAGGPYDAVEGTPLQLDGRRAVDPDDDSLTFAWDPDYDGAAFSPDAGLNGPRPTITYPDDAQTLVALRVRDAAGAESEVATAPARIANAAPEVALGVAGASVAGDPFVREGSFRDPGADEWTATIDYGDGDAPEPLALGADKTFRIEHRYQTAGERTVRVCVHDDDDGEGCREITVTVEPKPDGPVHEAPPRATILQPIAGDVVRPGQVIAVRARDLEAGVAVVAVRACPGAACAWNDGVPVGSDETAPYEVVWTPDAEGSYTLVARATDRAGKTGDSPPVTVEVAIRDEPPTPTAGSKKVVLTLPDGSHDLEAVALAARLADAGKKVKYRVVFEFRAAGEGSWQELSADARPPYRQVVDLSDLAPGYYEVRAVAIAKGKRTASTAVIVTVPAPEARRAPAAARENGPPDSSGVDDAIGSAMVPAAADATTDAAGAAAGDDARPAKPGVRRPGEKGVKASETRRERGRRDEARDTERRQIDHAKSETGRR